MATTNLEVIISGRDNFTSTANKVKGEIASVGRAADNVANKRFFKGGGQVLGGLWSLAKVGVLATGAALSFAAKQAIDFEDAFANVRKTVEDTPEALDALKVSLKDLSTRIPISFADLAGIATQAGALGVPTKNIVAFTNVVARLSAATVGLTPEAAADAFGKLGNVLKLSGDDYERAGSSLVKLGNNAASSEVDIIEVAKRFGAAGHQAGLSASAILGWASTIASLGIEPESAGTSLSRFFNNINLYIGTGSEKLKSFAAVSHKTVAQFTKDYKEDASAALVDFLAGLSKLDKFQAAAALKAAGISNSRQISAILLLAQGHEELARQLLISNDAWDKNTELMSVSETRFNTTRASLVKLWHTIQNVAGTFADEFIPAIGRSAIKLMELLKLPSTEAGFKEFGKSISDMIDGIDWKAALDGAKTFIGLLATILGTLKNIVGSQAAIGGAVLLTAISTPVIGPAIGQIGKGLANLVTGLIGKIGQAIGGRAGGIISGGASLFAQPVFVTNWPLGFGAGGVGGAGDVAGGIAKGFAGMSVALWALIASMPLILAGDTPISGGGAVDPTEDAARRIFEMERRVEELGRMDPAGLAFPGNEVGNTQTVAQEIARLKESIDRLQTTGGFLSNRSSGGLGSGGIFPRGVTPRSAGENWLDIFGSHKGMSGKDLRDFRTNPASDKFESRIRYLSTAQGSGAGSASFLALVGRDIAALKLLLPNATKEQGEKIRAEIATLEAIIEAKKFTVTPGVLDALNPDKTGGLSPDDRSEAITAAVDRVNDNLERNRLDRLERTPNNFNFTILPPNVFVSVREFNQRWSLQMRVGPTAGSAIRGQTSFSIG